MIAHHVPTCRLFLGLSKVLRASLGQRMPFRCLMEQSKKEKPPQLDEFPPTIGRLGEYNHCRYLLRQHTLPIESLG
jgi:hypothetical protein